MTKAAKVESIFETAPASLAAANDQVRKMAEDAMTQSKDAYAKMKVAVEDSQKVIEDTFSKTQAVNSDLGMKAISAMRKSSEASLTHMEKLLGVKSVSEFVELQTAFIRAQTELTISEAKVLQDAATKAAEEVTAPVKGAMETAMKTFKVA